MLNFNDWSKKDKKTREKGYTLTKDEPFLLDDEPVKKNKSIPKIVRRVCDYISVHNN